MDDGLVVYIPSSERFFDLTGSAAELFSALATADWRPQVAVQQLLDNYWVTESRADEIVRDYMDDLERNGILSGSGTGPGR